MRLLIAILARWLPRRRRVQPLERGPPQLPSELEAQRRLQRRLMAILGPPRGMLCHQPPLLYPRASGRAPRGLRVGPSAAQPSRRLRFDDAGE